MFESKDGQPPQIPGEVCILKSQSESFLEMRQSFDRLPEMPAANGVEVGATEPGRRGDHLLFGVGIAHDPGEMGDDCFRQGKNVHGDHSPSDSLPFREGEGTLIFRRQR